jgi:hypothetical protein
MDPVKKEGENIGRMFWHCTKPRGEQCDFFEWADQPPRSAVGGGGGGGTGTPDGGGVRGDECYKVESSYMFSSAS